jgi:DNA-binding NtrC family response regulator
MPARVLVIDDNLELASNLADILEGADLGVEVVCSPEGQSGLAEARRGGFDVAIVDVKLPDGSGVELVPLLRTASPFGEVLVITGAATIDAAVAALRGGAFAFVLKSFRPEELISTVEQALAKVALKRDREGLERRYRALVEAADVLIVGLDAEGRVTLANPRLTQMTGDPPDASLGAPFAERYIAS